MDSNIRAVYISGVKSTVTCVFISRENKENDSFKSKSNLKWHTTCIITTFMTDTFHLRIPVPGSDCVCLVVCLVY